MKNSALVVIDLQNDITKNYKEIIAKVNEAIDWAEQKELWIVYIQHNNLSAGTRTFTARHPWCRAGAGAERRIRPYLYEGKEQRPDQRGIYRLYSGAWNFRILRRWCGCRGLHQIHLLQYGKKRLYRSCAVGLHHQLR